MSRHGVVANPFKRLSPGRAPSGFRPIVPDPQARRLDDVPPMSWSRPPSWRFGAARMAPAAFLWLVGAWMAAVVLLLAGVILARHLV
jgi:hypothetical protein